MIRALAIACMTGLTLAGCSGSNDEVQADTATPTPVLTGCSTSQVETRVRSFARSLRQADLDALDVVWGDRFKWFTVGVQRRSGEVDYLVDARTPDEALDAIEEVNGIPVRMRDVQFNGTYRGAADFQYSGRWGSSRKQEGKGNMLCESPQIRVWSMAVRAQR